MGKLSDTSRHNVKIPGGTQTGIVFGSCGRGILIRTALAGAIKVDPGRSTPPAKQKIFTNVSSFMSCLLYRYFLQQSINGQNENCTMHDIATMAHPFDILSKTSILQACIMNNTTPGSSQSSSPSSPQSAVTNPLLPYPTHYSARSPSRWVLAIQAHLWRLLARIGFYLHTIPKPTPSEPSFFGAYATASNHGAEAATLQLAFYVPADYHREIERGRRYPAVVNFHGGGFTLGRYSDDARWATAIVRHASSIVVGVTYRLAPEYSFPTAVDDGVYALLHLFAQASSLGIDPTQISLSGFSAGGNLAFTVALRLQSYLRTVADPRASASAPTQLASIIAWYPNVDNRLTRDQRRAVSLKPSKTLPPVLTSLFDASYFPNAASVESPYASPAAASDEELKMALPADIALFLCEWDMLLQEGKDFAERLIRLGKRVRCEIITEREHAFDKKPWPFTLDWKADKYYKQAWEWLREVHRASANQIDRGPNY
ncbi:MAG: hypothetical protein Q9169_004157 [Polycauliona sp. 2 TL-2023]